MLCLSMQALVGPWLGHGRELPRTSGVLDRITTRSQTEYSRFQLLWSIAILRRIRGRD